GINDTGVIAGDYYDSNVVLHGFVRAADGTVTAFDPTGSVETEVWGINAAGTASGTYQDGNPGPFYGFTRAADGTITSFQVSASDTFASGMNDNGAVTGSWSNGAKNTGFARAADGTTTSFDG